MFLKKYLFLKAKKIMLIIKPHHTNAPTIRNVILILFFYISDMVPMPRWSTSWGRPSLGVTHSTSKPNRSQGACKRPPHIPPSSWTGGLCTPALWCPCWRSSSETSLSSPDVWRWMNTCFIGPAVLHLLCKQLYQQIKGWVRDWKPF